MWLIKLARYNRFFDTGALYMQNDATKDIFMNVGWLKGVVGNGAT